MAELFVTVCLLATNQCSDLKVPGGTAATVEACMKTSDQKIEEWYQSDPKNTQYKVMSRSCRKR
jgi:hypothetical protein